jgi:anion-transporting  ArsA/GET3 family ATPase
VGKTTVSAALAMRLAQEGKKTLVITIDPARRLAQELGIDVAKSEPQHVGQDELYGLVLDIRQTFDRIVRRFSPSPEHADRLMGSTIYTHMVNSLLGMQEYMAIEELHEHCHSNTWDAIVLDTPPSKHVVDFFEAPQRVARFFGGQSARWLVRFAKGTRFVVKGLKLLWGAHFLNELVSYFTDLEVLFDGFVSRAREMEQLIQSDQCHLLFVTTPARYFLYETKQLRDRLSGFRLPNSHTVLNRVASRADSAAAVSRLKQVVTDRATLSAWENAYATLQRDAEKQAAFVEDLRRAGQSLVVLERVDYEISSVDGLRRLATHMDLSALGADT